MASVKTFCWKKIFLLSLLTANLDEFVIGEDKTRQCEADQKEPWSYWGENGPSHWGEKYPDCNGTQQSPIDINKYTINTNLPPLATENYDKPVTNVLIENNGRTIEVFPKDFVYRAISVDDVTYTLRKLCFHWGSKKGNGSEHTFAGTSYDMGIHFEHVNREQMQSRYAVIAVSVREIPQGGNRELNKIAEKLKYVPNKNEKTQMISEFDLRGLLPSNPISYYGYEGSSTTPPCSEGFKWIVAVDSIVASTIQMKQFRDLSSATREDSSDPNNKDCTLSDNNRPTQPLNGREVYRSKEN